ncbi:MAG: XTP/dITP diphosphatase [Archaeoglobaceae archaeon]|nr:XTP/dITP diphosphatase [Archaeoglobaceae archaeon]MDW7989889.1 XTP/dITP diphosphatase [Archaeoglobaceae archaeon]
MLFITSNKGKFKEVKEVAKIFSIEIEWLNREYEEPQGESLEEIAIKSAKKLAKEIKEPFFIEDSGLFIESLNGFPGPYSSYVFKTIGNKGIIKLMEGIESRGAYFKAVIAFFDGSEIKTFDGIVYGEISREIRGGGGFGFDPIFLYGNRTFAEMGDEKNLVSHRRRVLEKFFSSLKKQA